MTRNEKKLTEMVETVMTAYPFDYGERDCNCEYYLDKQKLRTALTPFCMEMTDEEIMTEGEKLCSHVSLFGFVKGAKFIRDGNR